MPVMFKYRDKQQLPTIHIHHMIPASILQYTLITVTENSKLIVRKLHGEE